MYLCVFFKDGGGGLLVERDYAGAIGCVVVCVCFCVMFLGGS